MQKKQGGKEIGKVDFYKMTRTKKDGSFVTTTSEENYIINIPICIHIYESLILYR